MARKTLGTRQKLVFRLPPTRPGNPFAALAKQRKAGPHGKSRGALRRAARGQLVNQPCEEDGQAADS